MTAAAIVKNPVNYPGQAQLSLVAYTFSSSYATGGEVVTNTQLGFSGLSTVIPLGPSTNGYTVKWTGSGLKVTAPGAVTANAVPLRVFPFAGGAAGAHTATGVAATDVIVSVLYFATSTGAVTAVTEDKANDWVLSANTATNTGGTNTTSGFVVLIVQRPSDITSTPAKATEVVSTTDLSGETVQLLVIGQN
jgi:hypothetical protein